MVFLVPRSGRGGAAGELSRRAASNAVTNYSAKATYQPTRNDRFVAYGQVGRNHQPNRLDPQGSPV